MQRKRDLNSPCFFHTEEQLPVVHFTMMIRISKNLRAEGAREQHFSIHSWTNGASSTFPFSRSLLLSLRLICRSTLVSPLLMRMKCHRVSPPSATATELQGRQAAHLYLWLWPHFPQLFNEVEASWPGQHPQEDDTLVSCGRAEDTIGRRGLIISLLEIVGRDVLAASYLCELMKTKQVEFWQKNLCLLF